MGTIRRTRTGPLAAAVTAAALVLAGCGGEDPQPEIDTELESACSLVDVTAVGSFYGADPQIETNTDVLCRIGVGGAAFEARFTPASSEADFDAALENRPDAEPIDNLGDEAFYSAAQMTATFLQDDLLVSVQAIGGPGTTDEVAEFVIARARAIADQL